MKNVYKAPSTRRVRVEVEGSICTASVKDVIQKEQHVEINKQEDGGTFDFQTESQNAWDN